jgi:hypothetical protein
MYRGRAALSALESLLANLMRRWLAKFKKKLASLTGEGVDLKPFLGAGAGKEKGGAGEAPPPSVIRR